MGPTNDRLMEESMANNNATEAVPEQLGHYEIYTPDGDPLKTRIMVDGRRVTNACRFTLTQYADELAVLKLEMEVWKAGAVAEGMAQVVHEVGHVRFSAADIQTLRREPLDVEAVRDIGRRLAEALGIEVNDGQ